MTILAQDEQGESIDFKDKTHKKRLEKWILPKNRIQWLKLVHEAGIIELPAVPTKEIIADGAITKEKNTACIITTADCLPLVFTNKAGSHVGVAHAGWRGLHARILPKMASKFKNPKDLLVWLGPGIAQKSYEVGPEMRNAFLGLDKDYAPAFAAGRPGKYQADLYQIARLQLTAAGIPPTQITGGNFDTFTDKRFHSYRRDGLASGRMATLVFITNQ